MARLLRVQFPGAIYHVTVRGNERRLIFRDDPDRGRFLERLAQSQELYSVRLYLVCLMLNHLHLLLETPSGNLSNFMARLVTAYTVYYNLRHHRVGHLTQGHYKAQMVEGNEYLLTLSRYIHLNPVCGKRWSVVSVENRREALRAYGWSTYRSYAAIPRASLMECRRGLLARATAAWALVRHAGLTQRGAAAALGMRTGGRRQSAIDEVAGGCLSGPKLASHCR